MSKMCFWGVMAFYVSLQLGGCKKDVTPFFEPEPDETDPECLAISDWEDEIEVRASFVEPETREQIQLAIEPKKEMVDVAPEVVLDGGEIFRIVYDDHNLWLVLLPVPEVAAVTVEGSLRCPGREAGFQLRLEMSEDIDEITTHIRFFEDGMDAGITDGGADTAV